MSIVQNLAVSARRWPARIALEAETGITYADLWRRVHGLAGWLRREGLQEGDRAALVLANSIEYVVAYYAILSAGGIAVALNSAAKSRDFGSWLAHCGATWLFAEPGNAEVNAACQGLATPPRRVDVDLGGKWLGGIPEAADAPPQGFPGDRPAAIIYTSGTTGTPKGVLLSHGNLASNAAAIVQYLELGEHDRIVNVLPFYYSYGNSVLHSHLAVGATIVLAENMVFPHLIVEMLARSRATRFAGVPSTFLLMLSRGRLAEYDLSALRQVMQAGGAMPPAIVDRLREALPQVQIVIMYGQTEATARICWLPPARLAEKPGSVGIAIPGVRLRVVREDGAEVGPDESGEVCVQGPNVMLGYWDNPAATAAAIRDGWLHTGDIGRLDRDGYLYLDGRRSDMIKTGAHRVYPEDVEAVISELPGVLEVAVVGMNDEVLGEAVRAVIVAAEGAEIEPQQVRAYCRARLANYKIPKVIEFRQSLPRTASGKIQRQVLWERKKLS